MTDTKRQEKAVATAMQYGQGDIAGLDDTMTRRLIASTVFTESNGGDLAISNKQGYIGRYQAGAAWLADAGFVNQEKLESAMAGYRSEWAWAQSGGMTRFLQSPSNWTNGLNLEGYKASPELQNEAFKRNCDAAYHRAIKNGVLHESDAGEQIAGFLKARHISGYDGAKEVIEGGRPWHDANGTSNYDYYNDIVTNRDGLNRLMVGVAVPATQRSGLDEPVAAAKDHIAGEDVIRRGAHGPQVRQLQASLARLGYQDIDGRPPTIDGDFGTHTHEAVTSFQRAHGLTANGIVEDKTQLALLQAKQSPLLSEATHSQHHLYSQVLRGIDALPQGTYRNELEQTNAAVALTISAHVSGLTQIDHILLGKDGTNLFAVQGRVDDPLHRRVHVNHANAMSQPVDQQATQMQLQQPHQAAMAVHSQIEHRGVVMGISR